MTQAELKFYEEYGNEIYTTTLLNKMSKAKKVMENKSLEQVAEILKEDFNVTKIKTNYLVIKPSKQHKNKDITQDIKNKLTESMQIDILFALQVKNNVSEIIIKLKKR